MVLPSGERLGNLGDPPEPDTNWWSESGIREVRRWLVVVRSATSARRPAPNSTI
jgi:hypothetical protein